MDPRQSAPSQPATPVKVRIALPYKADGSPILQATAMAALAIRCLKSRH
jgi:hypothetical protein